MADEPKKPLGVPIARTIVGVNKGARRAEPTPSPEPTPIAVAATKSGTLDAGAVPELEAAMVMPAMPRTSTVLAGGAGKGGLPIQTLTASPVKAEPAPPVAMPRTTTARDGSSTQNPAPPPL